MQKRFSEGNFACGTASVRSDRSQVSAMPSVESEGEAHTSEHRRFLVGLVTVHLLWYEVVLSQRAHGVFGATIEYPLERTPAALFVSPGPGMRSRIEVVTNDPPGIDLCTLTDRGGIEGVSTVPLQARCRMWTVAESDGNGIAALAGLTPLSDTLVIARRRGPGMFVESSLPLDLRPHGLCLADVDNDRQREILLFGKSMAGIQVIKRRADGSYRVGPLLFPDLSAAAVAVTDVNGDGIPDMFIANWLSNQVALFFGIARNVFTEQVIIELESEPGGLSITPVSKGRTLALAILMPGAKTIAVYSVNGAGEFRRTGTITTPLTPQQAGFMDLNGDGRPDLVVASDKGLQTVLARSTVDFEPPVIYGVGNIVDLWHITDLDQDRHRELVCVDRSGRRLIVSSTGSPGSRIPWPATYLAGHRPQGVILADVNGDGVRDILVANEGSSSISCFLNDGTGGFAPQITIGTPEKPSMVRAVDGEAHRFVVAHRGEGKLSVVSTAVWNAPSVFSIPTAADPVVLRALHRRRDEPLRILVSARGGAQQSATFSLFEQLTGKNFLEKTFTTLLPTAFRGITTASITDDTGTDLLFLTADRSGKKYTISYASAGVDFDYRAVQTLFSFTDSTTSFRAVQATDVDGDGIQDVVVVGNSRGKGVGVIYGQASGGYDPTIRWIVGLVPNGGGLVLFEDLDGDSVKDCVAIDHSARTIRVAYGRGERRFFPGQSIAQSVGVSSFGVGPLRNSTSRDLVFTHEERGTVSIIFNAFAR